MTPLIQEMVAMNPEKAIDHHWFDMSAAYRREQRISGEILSRPLPFPHVALVCGYEDKKVVLFVTRSDSLTGIIGLQWDKKNVYDLPPFFFLVDDEGIKVRHKDGTPFDYRTSPATGVLAFVAAFLESLDVAPATGYLPVKRANWEKKVRQGKTPTYDWTTITVQPPTARGPDQGGTHASPRWHERRGHWRTLKKSGKQVWVKNCEVGDKARGAVFHDYTFQQPKTQS